MIRYAIVCIASVLALGAQAESPAPAVVDGPTVELAICMDTSDSMKALLDGTRIELWEIVGDLAEAQPTPRLRVALLSYGNAHYEAREGYVRLDAPFTADLDEVSERLFGLSAKGGAEYVGRVLRAALDELEWSEDAPDLTQLILLVGNESANQAPQVDLEEVSARARERGLIVNVFYGGRPDDEHSWGWEKLARLGWGKFETIGLRGVDVPPTPFDEELADLGESINETYVPLGDEGAKALERQQEQDRAARDGGLPAAAARALTKTSALYTQDWDLVDALDTGALAMFEVPDDRLPAALRGLTADELEARVARVRAEREEIRSRISELGEQRTAFLTDHEKARDGGGRTLGEAIRRTVREQLAERGFRFESSDPG